MSESEFDIRDERKHGGTYLRASAGNGLASLDLPYIRADISREDTDGSSIAVHDSRAGIALDLGLHLKDGGRIGSLVSLDAQTAEQLGEALLAAADTERTRAMDDTPAAISSTLNGDDA